MKQTFPFRLLLAVLLPSLAVPAFAQQTNSAKHCLWEVESGTNKIYLFGTIHYSSSNFFPLPTVVEQAFARSETVMFETDLDEQRSPAGRSNALAASTYPASDSLRNHLSPQVYSNVQAYLVAAGEKGGLLDSIKPFMATMTLVDHATRQFGLDSAQSVDGYLWQKARKDKKHVVPLETFKQTLGILANLNDSQQEYMVRETFYEIAETNHIIRDLTLAWISGETEKADKYVFESLRKNPELGKILLTDRNKKWMPSIEAQIKRGEKLFIAVGLGHLLGKDSLVDLLSKRGFKVRQL
jgi:uncharacterized protein YbaP (TraB family)